MFFSSELARGEKNIWLIQNSRLHQIFQVVWVYNNCFYCASYKNDDQIFFNHQRPAKRKKPLISESVPTKLPYTIN